MNYILYGYKRCGKTHFGKLLAKKVGRNFVDTDHIIESLYQKRYNENKDCRTIHREKGNTFFRKLEKEAILSLKGSDHLIISIGGGGVLDPGNVHILQEIGQLIYLQLDKATLKKRMFEGKLASYIEGKDPEQAFETMYQNRKPVYEKIASIKIDIQGKSEEEVLEILTQIIQGEKNHGK